MEIVYKSIRVRLGGNGGGVEHDAISAVRLEHLLDNCAAP